METHASCPRGGCSWRRGSSTTATPCSRRAATRSASCGSLRGPAWPICARWCHSVAALPTRRGPASECAHAEPWSVSSGASGARRRAWWWAAGAATTSWGSRAIERGRSARPPSPARPGGVTAPPVLPLTLRDRPRGPSMFDALTDRLQGVMQSLKGHGKLSAEDVDAATREIRLALLEADVNFKVVREFVAHVKERALGAEVMESLTPAQQVVKIVNEELVELMGSGDSKLAFSGHPPTVILLAGLQGSGKTTACAKLANLLKKDGKRPVLIAADVYRPAAIDQLQTLGERINVPVYAPGADVDPVDIARDGVKYCLLYTSDAADE